MVRRVFWLSSLCTVQSWRKLLVLIYGMFLQKSIRLSEEIAAIWLWTVKWLPESIFESQVKLFVKFCLMSPHRYRVWWVQPYWANKTGFALICVRENTLEYRCNTRSKRQQARWGNMNLLFNTDFSFLNYFDTRCQFALNSLPSAWRPKALLW